MFPPFLMHLCGMQVNRISMERAKCAQANKTCRQSGIFSIKLGIKVKLQLFIVVAMHYHLSF